MYLKSQNDLEFGMEGVVHFGKVYNPHLQYQSSLIKVSMKHVLMMYKQIHIDIFFHQK